MKRCAWNAFFLLPASSPLQVSATAIDLADVNGDQIPDLTIWTVAITSQYF